MSHSSPKVSSNNISYGINTVGTTSGNNNNNNSSGNSNNAILTSNNSDDEYTGLSKSGGLDNSGGIGAPSGRYSSIYDQDNTYSHSSHQSNAHHSNRTCASYADRVLFSNKYYYAYIFMIILNLILILWKTSVPSHWLFVVLDISVNIALLVEISLQITSQKSRYFKEWSNRLDLFVLVLSIAGLFMYLLSHASIAFDYEGIVIIFFTAMRYCVQFLRLLALIKRQKMRASTFNSRVDFNELKESDLVFDVDTSDYLNFIAHSITYKTFTTYLQSIILCQYN
ncbi:hypothetical protein PPL_07955 [Heterostelium album PN500]|uniref:Ion transport domain-containing protein n=1 Tax=Heterostelium pallidum (strain ATCC 26659 / Pp 5 / PN500) TaxID=670386 RepID=D3BHF3_HETP5|nr:hypothetical protein PPL_07955 [Heterostelium album PN500]EFA79130.1 hypothetical protein PPL_07955 [Heterostelium album PN500]|eukprot:XP_020431252.1 hypothetical protein PPL_07955 [Heterostelium album PN500]